MAFKSEGKCVYCEKTYAKAGIGRHLTTHLKKMQASKSKHKAFHVQISAAEMFLHVLIDGKETFAALDAFLRGIWLECCGHMSSFNVQGKRYNSDWDFDATEFGEPKTQAVSKVFTKGQVLRYEYDFGSSTQLGIKVTNEYNMAVPEGILLLSRNEPLPILCHICKEKPAVEICSIHLYDDESFFCVNCAEKHANVCEDFADYAAMPVVNSPRMGVCAYDGGSIDQERDGIWKE